MDTEQQYLLPDSLRTQLARYLETRPIGECLGMYQALAGLQLVHDVTVIKGGRQHGGPDGDNASGKGAA